MSDRIRIGISTCPNDTFAFHGILTGAISQPGLEFDIELLDIQQLNERLFQSQFDVAKASFHAALLLADRMWVLPSGSALGYGVGPLLLSSPQLKDVWDLTEPNSAGWQPGDLSQAMHRIERIAGRPPIVLAPGQHTTATLLFQIFFQPPFELKQVVFSEIMPALEENHADLGVCIHEGRFTWRDKNLGLFVDLGNAWEKLAGTALPLGGLLASRQLEMDKLHAIQRLIRKSIEFGLAHPQETLPTMRKYAQEFSDDVLMAHVDLYVNKWTVDLGAVGQQSLSKLNQLALEASVIPSHSKRLEILPR